MKCSNKNTTNWLTLAGCCVTNMRTYLLCLRSAVETVNANVLHVEKEMAVSMKNWHSSWDLVLWHIKLVARAGQVDSRVSQVDARH